jgi:hypothetical protein
MNVSGKFYINKVKPPRDNVSQNGREFRTMNVSVAWSRPKNIQNKWKSDFASLNIIGSPSDYRWELIKERTPIFVVSGTANFWYRDREEETQIGGIGINVNIKDIEFLAQRQKEEGVTEEEVIENFSASDDIPF